MSIAVLSTRQIRQRRSIGRYAVIVLAMLLILAAQTTVLALSASPWSGRAVGPVSGGSSTAVGTGGASGSAYYISPASPVPPSPSAAGGNLLRTLLPVAIAAVITITLLSTVGRTGWPGVLTSVIIGVVALLVSNVMLGNI